MASKTPEMGADYEKVVAGALALIIKQHLGAIEAVDRAAPGGFEVLMEALAPLRALSPSYGAPSEQDAARFKAVQEAMRRADISKASRPPDADRVYLTFVVQKGSRR